MPQRVICHSCRYVLYEEESFSPLSDVISRYAGACPNCGRILSLLPLDVEVSLINK